MARIGGLSDVTVIVPRTLDTTLTLPATTFNNPVVSGTLATMAAPSAAQDPSGMFVNANNITLKGNGTYTILAYATFQGTANYHLRLEIQVNSVTVADTGQISNSLAAQNVPYQRALFYRAALNNGDVVRICGGFAGGAVAGQLLIAKETYF